MSWCDRASSRAPGLLRFEGAGRCVPPTFQVFLGGLQLQLLSGDLALDRVELLLIIRAHSRCSVGECAQLLFQASNRSGERANHGERRAASR